MKVAKNKIFSRPCLLQLVEDLKKQGKKIVFTNGCFDIIHLGHIRLLEQAKTLGDFLIVGINSDESVRRLKGHERPIIQQEDRAEILAALEAVNAVTIFSEDTPETLIKMIRPDIHIKGGDYDIDQVPEAKVVEEYGGQVRFIPVVPGRSTTELIERIKKGG
ncbi:MAG: D-glycero-beta-D-manno-heptose 1-phosphate adenylyltransferase [Candidatus Eremiobacteraeota bacterium]|nr:D-glycero-beta-D-manno-heptose 1-phosphate adenylyltransferase [Candidatus Eremiobacteraeota bacterium]